MSYRECPPLRTAIKQRFGRRRVAGGEQRNRREPADAIWIGRAGVPAMGCVRSRGRRRASHTIRNCQCWIGVARPWPRGRVRLIRRHLFFLDVVGRLADFVGVRRPTVRENARPWFVKGEDSEPRAAPNGYKLKFKRVTVDHEWPGRRRVEEISHGRGPVRGAGLGRAPLCVARSLRAD